MEHHTGQRRRFADGPRVRRTAVPGRSWSRIRRAGTAKSVFVSPVRRRRRAAFAVFVLTERIRPIETMGQRRLNRHEMALVTRGDRTLSHIRSLYQNGLGTHRTRPLHHEDARVPPIYGHTDVNSVRPVGRMTVLLHEPYKLSRNRTFSVSEYSETELPFTQRGIGCDSRGVCETFGRRPNSVRSRQCDRRKPVDRAVVRRYSCNSIRSRIFGRSRM